MKTRNSFIYALISIKTIIIILVSNVKLDTFTLFFFSPSYRVPTTDILIRYRAHHYLYYIDLCMGEKQSI